MQLRKVNGEKDYWTSVTPTCTFNWHKVWFSYGHTNVAGTKQVYLTVFAGFLHPSSNSALTTNRALLHYSFVETFFSKKRSNHGSLLFDVHSTIKKNKNNLIHYKNIKELTFSNFRSFAMLCFTAKNDPPLLFLLSHRFSLPPPPPISPDKNTFLLHATKKNSSTNLLSSTWRKQTKRRVKV